MFELGEEVIRHEGGSAAHHKGVKVPVFPNGPQTLPEVFNIPISQGAQKNEFLVYEDKRYTYEQGYAEAAALGAALVNDYGVERGDRVCMLSKNRHEYIVAFIAITSIGAVFVPMNSYWKTKELEYGLENSGTKVLICDADRYANAEPLLDKLPELQKVFLCDGPGSDAFKPHAKLTTYNEAVGKRRGASMPPFTANKDGNAIIMYTSGTTGHPKGVVLTHRSITHALVGTVAKGAINTAVSNALAGTPPSEPSDTVGATMLNVPLFHVTGLLAVCFISIVAKRKIVLLSKWEPEKALQIIEREKISSFSGVPTMVLDLMAHPNFSKYDTSSLDTVGGGGAAPPTTMVKDVSTKFKRAAPLQGFGMTETSGVTGSTVGEIYKLKPTSCGSAIPGLYYEIWDDNDKPLPPGQKGNLMVKAASVLKEYWRNPEATAKTITPDGWLRTGDVGMLDEDGYLHLGGRTKEIIIRGGENISCVAVEDGVYQHPGVAECAAIPVAHPTLGEEVGIVVYPKPGAEVTLEAIRAACVDLASFELPTHLYIWPDQLPRGATGKIFKRGIRDAIDNGKILSEQQKKPAAKL
ncbi:Acyl-coA synthetase, putative [Hondaea fermentalgiana]|uniref:Acyl-coA synthetase, putative n=1 Tax=Hondaea fermentalgiana TaxID=2315210 RepID=A0A2R5GPX0_9STRA|nr:Acyl-coA synthetase, putative [Hondaea fermentalgiana]|eukprot:GBG32655.1 Acyl-coA synthetase, putative [Hondaea fermentalgiana]